MYAFSSRAEHRKQAVLRTKVAINILSAFVTYSKSDNIQDPNEVMGVKTIVPRTLNTSTKAMPRNCTPRDFRAEYNNTHIYCHTSASENTYITLIIA
jgi:hypothetical protein